MLYSDTPQKMSVRQKLLFAVGGAVVALGLSWIILALAAQVWLAINVPLSSNDIRFSSWLGSPTTSMHFTTGIMAVTIQLAMAFIAIAMAFSSRSFIPVFIVAFILACSLIGLNETSIMRIGILDETIKIGCYVEKTAECRDMLGLPRNGYASMYDTNGEFNTEYLVARRAIVTDQQELLGVAYSLPGIPLLRAPLYMFQAERLHELVNEQRRSVARLRSNE